MYYLVNEFPYFWMEETIWNTGLKAYGAISLKFCQVCATKSIQRPAYYVEFDAMCKIVFGSCLFSGTYSLKNLVFYFRNKHFPINTI